ncbi:MAG: hypothetical protein JO246_09970, partial [Frankiaceae bacterium]|nr:hypothetical protein [Frankiaceae bacterium]
MSLRRVALALAAILGMATGAAGATAAQARPTASGSTICVALVVDGRNLGGGVSSACATVKKGATGVDVLRAEGHSVGFRQDGLICTIDNLPSSGCADVDDTHYWAYFHRAPGATSWTYSTEGASTYQPSNTSTEGWVYRDGGSLTPPENVPYASICKPKPTPKPAPSNTKSSKPKPRPIPTTSQSHRRHHAGPTAATSTPVPTATSDQHGGKKSHQHHKLTRRGEAMVDSDPTAPQTRITAPVQGSASSAATAANADDAG